MAHTRFAILVVLALALQGCGTSPPVRYFNLESTAGGGSSDDRDAAVMGMGPLRVPGYLNRSQLVTGGSGPEMTVHEFSRWTEPLGTSMLRIVATDVDSLVDGLVVLMFPYESVVRGEVDFRLVGDVNLFHADSSGRVVLDVQWGVARMGSGMAVSTRRSHYTAQASSATQPEALVSAMNQAMAEFARDIAAAIRPVVAEQAQGQ